MQILLWHGIAALSHGKGRPEATVRANEHHHSNVSELSYSDIVVLMISVLSHAQSQWANTDCSINDILSVHKEIVSISTV